MLRLLLETRRPGYPADYLVARIHGRFDKNNVSTQDVFGERNTFHENDNHIWWDAGRERKWLYQQMELPLRRTLAPLLVFFELNELILALRELEEGSEREKATFLETSILNSRLRNVLQVAATPVEILSKVEKFLAEASLQVRGLTGAYQDGGLQKCEEMFRARFLEQILLFCQHRVVAGFFRMAIDIRNTMTTAKALRWSKKDPLHLIAGGNMRILKSDRIPSEDVLRKMVKRVIRVDRLSAEELQPVQLETILHANLTKTMTRQMRSFHPVKCCSGYVYHSFARARQRSQDFHTSRFHERFSGSGAGIA